MIRIGILGNIGSGKTFVANHLVNVQCNAEVSAYKNNKKIFKKLNKKLPKYISSFPIKKTELTKAILASKPIQKPLVLFMKRLEKN